MMVEMSDLFGFVNDLEKIIYGLGFKLIIKRNNNDRALIRVEAGAGAVANDGNIDLETYHGVYLVLILVMTIELLYRKDYIKRIILILVIMKKRPVIRICTILLTSYLILLWKMVWKDHNI